MRILRHITIIALGIAVLFVLHAPKAAALSGNEFQPSRIIDDSIFFNGSAMNASEIQNFLNAKVPVCDTNGTQPYAGTTRAAYSATKGYSAPFICLKNYSRAITAKSADTYCSGVVIAGTKSAAQIIYDVAQACGVSPKVLLVLLQKEQSLVADDWPWSIQYTKATGYGCPDTPLPIEVDANQNGCYDEYEGFFNQVYSTARQFRRYAIQPTLFNYAAGRTSFVSYQANAPSCGGTNITMQNNATAGLYNYTPYQPNAAALNNLYGTGDSCSAYGNRNFWRMYIDWFGNPIGPPDLSCKSPSNITAAGSGGKVISNRFTAGQAENLTLTFMNNTGSKCIELHTWGNNYNQWITNIATNHPVFDPADGELISGNLQGDNKSEMIFVKYRNTGSGKIEIHVWNPGYQTWATNIATSYPVSNPADFRVIASDINGDGVDELVLVKYRNTGSGKIEMHAWNPGYQTWMTNIATTMPIAESDNGYIISGNPYGESKDRLMFVKYQNTGSGKIEIHTWNPGYQTWSTNIATNHPAVSSSAATVIAADAYKEGRDRLIFVKYSGTGSGRIEVHIWNPGYQTWATNIATNYPSI